jgi:hypothetical protein
VNVEEEVREQGREEGFKKDQEGTTEEEGK